MTKSEFELMLQAFIGRGVLSSLKIKLIESKIYFKMSYVGPDSRTWHTSTEVNFAEVEIDSLNAHDVSNMVHSGVRQLLANIQRDCLDLK